jgi:hypothetical protein
MNPEDIPEDIEHEKIDNDHQTSRIFIVCLFGFLILLSLICVLSGLTSCTISLQNISTHGTSENLGDDDFKSNADVNPDISVPAIGI